MSDIEQARDAVIKAAKLWTLTEYARAARMQKTENNLLAATRQLMALERAAKERENKT